MTPDELRRFRHELRTPVNHLLGYTELLLEDTVDDDGELWRSQLQHLLESGQALLNPISDTVDAVREGSDTDDAVARIRALTDTIESLCDALDAEAERLGKDDAVADLGVIRTAATHLIQLISTPLVAESPKDSWTTEPTIADQSPALTTDEPGTILVVDDNQQNREMLSRRLTRLGHDVEVATGGREALERLRTHPFDVLLLDVMMPGMDGFEVLSHLKADPSLRDLPVIMLSALDEVASAVRCIEMGADDYLPKPIDTVLLRARIGACLERKRLRDTEVAYLRQAAQVTGPAIIAQILVTGDPGADPDTEEATLRASIEREADWIDAPKGSTLFAAGDSGDCMYVVVSGRLRVDEKDERGQPRQYGEARRGGTLGELEMLTGQPRTTTVTAVRDAHLARISRDAFNRLASAHPRLLTRTTRDVVERLRHAFQRRPVADPVTTFALVPLDEGIDIAGLAHDLTRALASLGDTLLLDREQLSDILGDDASVQLIEDPGTERLGAWLNEVELQHQFVVYRADPQLSIWTQRCLRQADHVLLVGHGRPGDDHGVLASEIARSAHGAPFDLLLLQDNATSHPVGTSEWLDRWDIRMHHHLRMGDRANVERVARRLTGTSVDLVLGGGGARGWAHVGVIRAIEEAGIPIDAIAGTSIGGLVAGASALGMNWQEIQEQARTWSLPRRLFDYTLPIVSIFSGKKFTTMLHAVYGDAHIEDLWRGFFCVSSSLTHAQPVVHRQGPLWKALRASISLPGLLPPVQEESDLLIDGAYLNNLPTDLMRDRYRSGVVVAVSVSQSHEMPGGIDTGSVVSGWEVLRNKLVPWESKIPPPSLAATIMRASSLSGAYNVSASMQQADLAIFPPVGQFGSLDFASCQQIIDVGYEAARRQIEQWQMSRELATSPATAFR